MTEETRVMVKIGTTLKLQEYENVRIDFQVEDTLRPEDEGSIEAGLDRVYNIVDRKLTAEVEKFRS